ncbi:hypothetical protein RZO55_08835 [Clostridium boliviensis]|uniref:DUF1049 domain-containing protein n=1 Tax=Clostridium boliviensis TaxID=318465 RepID=A0ABU4GKZ9_9CLOT|nr:hypothetical protein [Clostridium boliviensis]MDW2797677.1 hypothetical protein [Clostridium boliviensis]
MKKFAKNLLFILGLFILFLFFVLITYEYCVLKNRLFLVPEVFIASFLLSGILLFIPGISCMAASYLLKRHELK